MRDIAFTLKVMQQQFERFGRKMMNMRDDLEEVRQSQQTIGNQTGAIPHRRRGARQPANVDDYMGEDDEDDVVFVRAKPMREERIDSNINSIKMKIPSFKGRNDAETYLE